LALEAGRIANEEGAKLEDFWLILCTYCILEVSVMGTIHLGHDGIGEERRYN
jgi:hypothetical protein